MLEENPIVKRCMHNQGNEEYKFRKSCNYDVELMDYDKHVLECKNATGLSSAEKMGREMLEGMDDSVFVRICCPERPELIDFLTVARLERWEKKKKKGGTDESDLQGEL